MFDKDDTIYIRDFMIKDLKLYGAELLAYGVIYQYASVRPFKLVCSLKFLAERIGKTEKYTKTVVGSLIEKKLIEREKIEEKGIITIIYKVISGKKYPLSENNLPKTEKTIREKRKEAKEKSSLLSDGLEINNYKESNDYINVSVESKGKDSNTIKSDDKLQSINNKGLDSNTSKINNDDTSLDIQKNKRNIFVPPTVEEVDAYCKEKGYNVDAFQFWHWYDSVNWMRGKTKMVRWRSACATWNKKNSTNGDTGDDDVPHDLDYIFGD